MLSNILRLHPPQDVQQVFLAIERVVIRARAGGRLAAQGRVVVERAFEHAFAALDGVRMGCRVTMEEGAQFVHPSRFWLGRVIDGFARPLDGAGPRLDEFADGET